LEADTQSNLKEIIKQMPENNKQVAENNLQFQQHVQSSLQVIKVQIEQIVSNVRQIQENKMFHDDVKLVALLEVIQCDTSLEESPGEPIEIEFVSSIEHKIRNISSSECMKEIIPENFLKSNIDELYVRTSLEVDKSFEIFDCQCGVCNVCHEINASILG
jgi:hypothetical protein